MAAAVSNFTGGAGAGQCVVKRSYGDRNGGMGSGQIIQFPGNKPPDALVGSGAFDRFVLLSAAGCAGAGTTRAEREAAAGAVFRLPTSAAEEQRWSKEQADILSQVAGWVRLRACFSLRRPAVRIRRQRQHQQKTVQEKDQQAAPGDHR